MEFTRREVLIGGVLVASCGPSSPPATVQSEEPEDDLMERSDTSPLFLYASATIASGSGGGVNAAALKNTTKFPIEVRSILISLSDLRDVQDQAGVGNPASLAVRLEYGPHALTNGYVPVISLARNDGINYSNLVTNQIGGVTGTTSNMTVVRWRLPKPIWVPPGKVIVPAFQHTGLSPNSYKVGIGYNCRSINDAKYRPDRITLPYCAAWTSAGAAAYSTTNVVLDSSVETDLVNALSVPVNVTHFSGRLAMTSYSAGSTARRLSWDQQANYGDSPLAATDFDLMNRNLTAKITASIGSGVVDTFAPWAAIFGRETFAWDCPHVLSPGAYYIVDTNRAIVATLPDQATAQVARYQTFVSINGWRDVDAGSVR